jgi:CheY-like chemotaxis protein
MPGARILVIEDDVVLRNLLQRNLEARKHQVDVAADACAALALLRMAAIPFDLVILDINLPDQTGWEILRIAQQEGYLRLQARGTESPHLPVVVVTAVRASLARLKEFRPLAYLPKPFPIEALLRLAEESVQFSRKGAQSA